MCSENNRLEKIFEGANLNNLINSLAQLHDEIQSLKSEKLISSRLHSQKVSRIIIIEINILFEPITFLKEYKITHLMSEKERLEKILQGANSSILDFKNQNKTIKLKLDQEIESKSILEKKNVSIKIIS